MEDKRELLIKHIIDAAFEVRKKLVQGYLEIVYERALIIELMERGFKVESQKPIQINYRGHIVGDFKIDLLVEDEIVVEIKAVSQLVNVHEIQLVNYLTIMNRDVGLLINFGGDKFEVKRKHRLYNAK